MLSGSAWVDARGSDSLLMAPQVHNVCHELIQQELGPRNLPTRVPALPHVAVQLPLPHVTLVAACHKCKHL